MKAKIIIPFSILSFLLFFCSNTETKTSEKNSLKEKITFSKNPKFNDYWYQGTAEITSYKLSQFRYGEIHQGTAVNIFVTEDFLPEKQVKADDQNEKNIPILKLNSTKKFLTGIYPYSLMTSTFSPIDINNHALKISYSSQEWCGNTFAQLNNRDKYQIDFHSYFENNADKKITLEKTYLENEIWNLLRISPENLPIGILKMIPTFEYLSLNHKEISSYEASAKLENANNNKIYTIEYPYLKRSLSITFTNDFPHIIEKWEEKQIMNGVAYSSIANKIKTIKSKYWSQNKVLDTLIRKELGL